MLYRRDIGGNRYYYTLDEDLNPKFYVSVTTLIHKTLATSPHLIEWIANTGLEEAEKIKNERSVYGTCMHALFNQLLINRQLSLNDEDLELFIDNVLYSEKDTYGMTAKSMVYELRRDLLSFAQFVIDYDVKPLAIELCLKSDKLGIAGAIDLICSMNWRGARINAVIDYKSNREGNFYIAHEIQVHIYKDLTEENLKDIKIHTVFNFSPKNWTKKPTYTLKDQNKSKFSKILPHLMAIHESSLPINEYSDIKYKENVMLNLDDPKSIADCFDIKNISERVKENHENNH
jgi:hypothetical protein